jgi:hypothetical protein
VVILINIIGFNITWFGLVYFGNNFIAISILFLLIHLWFLSAETNEPLLILFVCAIGISVDSLLQYLNIFIFVGLHHIPYWLMFLWACFAATLCHSLRFLGKSIWFQLLAGLVAPLSYITGHKFEAVEFGQSLLITYLILATLWSALFVLFFSIKKRWLANGVNHA